MTDAQAAAFAPLSGRRLGMIDIGARDGILPHWEPVARWLDVLAFEADPEEAERLKTTLARGGAQVDVRPHAVWETRGTQTLHVTRHPALSSLYEPRRALVAQFPHTARFDVIERVAVETVTLDECLNNASFTPHFVKIDAQGGTLPVLRGGARALQSTLGLELEVELVPLYEGEPLFGEVDAFLRAKGFELIDLRPTYWRRETAQRVAGTLGQLIFGDVLYMVSPAEFARRLQAVSPDRAAHLLRCARLCCAVYGLQDWAMVYNGVAAELGLAATPRLPNAAGVRVARWPEFPLRHALGLALKDFGDLLLQSGDNWANAEQRLGSKLRSRHVQRFL